MRIRITFAKQGALRYTSHLDLHKLWERAARRAELPLAYSQGFHSQPKMNLAAALPLGFSSRCEVLDMRLEREIQLDGVREKIQHVLPGGIQVSKVEKADEGAPALQTQVRSANYEITFMEADSSVDASELKRRIDSVMQSTSIQRERRGKIYDLRPLIEELTQEGQDSAVRIIMRLAAREGATGRPEEVLAELGIAFGETRIERTRLIFQTE